MFLYRAEGLTARSQARELLALAAAEVWGLASLPEISRRKGGKPFFPEYEGLQFNLSHSGEFALCALDEAPVGVDIQIVKAWRPALPRRVCSQLELDWLEAQPEFWPSFAQLWTLKESRDGLWFRTWHGAAWAAAVCGHSAPPEKMLEKIL